MKTKDKNLDKKERWWKDPYEWKLGLYVLLFGVCCGVIIFINHITTMPPSPEEEEKLKKIVAKQANFDYAKRKQAHFTKKLEQAQQELDSAKMEYKIFIGDTIVNQK